MEGGEDSAAAAAIPRDARVVKALLKSMGVEDYEPRVLHQFLELYYRYVADILADAQVYSEHASKASIDTDDVKLAVQAKVNSSFTHPPPREVLMELARNRNKIPLPRSIPGPGIPIPPEQDTLISPSYQLFIPKHQVAAQPEDDDEEEDGEGGETMAYSTTAEDGDQPQQMPQQPQQPQQQFAQRKVSFRIAGTARPR